MRVDGNLVSRGVFSRYTGHEHNLRYFNGVLRAEAEAEVIGLIKVEWVRVKDLDC